MRSVNGLVTEFVYQNGVRLEQYEEGDELRDPLRMLRSMYVIKSEEDGLFLIRGERDDLIQIELDTMALHDGYSNKTDQSTDQRKTELRFKAILRED